MEDHDVIVQSLVGAAFDLDLVEASVERKLGSFRKLRVCELAIGEKNPQRAPENGVKGARENDGVGDPD
jgi:hypothetical protein